MMGCLNVIVALMGISYFHGRLRKCNHYCLLETRRRERERENKKKGGGLTASVLQANDHCSDVTVVCFNV